jgi:DNA uptake protein ComE-like DNA-binding protein
VKLKEYLLDYFVFSKKERLGVYIISIITLLVWAIPYFLSKEERVENVFHVTQVQIDSAAKILQTRNQKYATSKNFQSAKKSWSSYDANNQSDSYPKNSNKQFAPKQVALKPIDLNEADSSVLERLPMIGEKLSARIIKYRDKLGGFITVLQLKEVYGLSDSTYGVIVGKVFIEKQFKPRKVLINKVDYTELRKHPYSNHAFAKLVLAYRNIHGAYANVDAIKNVQQIDLEVLRKIEAYLSFEN